MGVVQWLHSKSSEILNMLCQIQYNTSCKRTQITYVQGGIQRRAFRTEVMNAPPPLEEMQNVDYDFVVSEVCRYFCYIIAYP